MGRARDLPLSTYDRYGPALVRKAARLLGSRADAEDVVQGLFLDLLNDGKATPSLPYLFKAVTHRCLNLLRDTSNRARLLERERDGLLSPPRSWCEGRVVDRDLVVKLSALLDDAVLTVLVLRYVDDLTQEEIAEVAGVSRKTVQKRLEKAHTEVARLAARGALG